MGNQAYNVQRGGPVPGLVGGSGSSTTPTVAQYKFIKISSEKLVLCDTQGEKALGVALEDLVTDRACPFAAVGDVVEVIASEAVAVGDEVTVDANGLAETAASGDFVMGTALTSTAAANERVTVLLEGHYVKA